MKKILTIIIAISSLLAFSGCSISHKTAKDNTHGYDVYLLIGQSNMAGRGEMLPRDTVKAIKGVYLLGPDGVPVPAKNPLNQYSTIRKKITLQQIGPGTAFGPSMYKHNGRNILLVVNAKGGSALNEWGEGTEFFNEAVRRCREGMKYGTLKGILWHQGCSDSSAKLQKTYLDRLSSMVKALRRELGVGEDVPFIAGELAYWRNSSHAFNEMIHGITEVIPNSAWVSAEGCGPLKPESLSSKNPDPHFSREGQLLLGRRYAEKMIEASQLMCCRQKKAEIPDTSKFTFNRTEFETQYKAHKAEWDAVFEFLANPGLDTMSAGPWHQLTARTKARVQKTFTREIGKWEAHRHVIDLFYVLEGTDKVGVCSIQDLEEITRPYSEEKDVELYASSSNPSYVVLKKGRGIILFPGEGHCPNLCTDSPDSLKIVVAKIPCD